MAETMREIYADKFRDASVPLPEIVTVSAVEFYGKGYEDSDRRIPNVDKARALLNWEPKWNVRDLLEATMTYYVNECPRTRTNGPH